ncbi:MAG TPA: hypothetical protein VMH83_08115 [Candidatus Acidoferrum sp.]|nr:hypothetical protein [Candidatus Acidoferrum sp.]
MIKAKTIKLALPPEVPEIVHVDYDLWVLRLTLRFASMKEPFYLQFFNTRGFRVLDEGDLLEFWKPENRLAGVAWEIESGGWLDLEKTRSGFLSALHPAREFLVVGANECVSVIGTSIPGCFSAKP